jgi:4-hydroxybenzoate polyprenyltransferase
MTPGLVGVRALMAEKAGIGGLLKLRAWGACLFALPIQISYFSMLYLLAKPGIPRPNVIALMMLLVALVLYIAYGVLVNDFFDREVDIAAGKFRANRGHFNSKGQLAATLAILAGAIVVLVALINENPIFDALWAVALFLATAYSSPPLKLKIRGVAGFLTDSVIEKPLPILIVFAFFGYYGFEIILFPIFGELLDSVFKHQVEDYDLDLKSGIKSFAIMIGRERSLKAENMIINPLDMIAVASLFLISYFELPGVHWLIIASGALIVLGLIGTAYLERKEKVRAGFPFPEPPKIGLLNFGLRAFLLGSLAIYVSLSAPNYLPMSIVAFISIAIYLLLYARFIPDLMHYAIPNRVQR